MIQNVKVVCQPRQIDKALCATANPVLQMSPIADNRHQTMFDVGFYTANRATIRKRMITLRDTTHTPSLVNLSGKLTAWRQTVESIR